MFLYTDEIKLELPMSFGGKDKLLYPENPMGLHIPSGSTYGSSS